MIGKGATAFRRRRGIGRCLLAVALTALTALTAHESAIGQSGPAPGLGEWPHYARDLAATHYSPLDQITPENVGQMRVAWEWKPGEKDMPEFGTRPGAFQNTPLMIDGVLYVSTPYNQVAALDPETGQERWRFDPRAWRDGQPASGQGFVHRGLAANSPQLRALFAAADLFVLPTTWDCMPLAILEAMAAGLPVIAARVGAIDEQVADGETGLLIPPRDAAALTDALAALLDDPARRTSLGAAGRRRAEACFDARKNYGALVELALQCAGAHPSHHNPTR